MIECGRCHPHTGLQWGIGRHRFRRRRESAMGRLRSILHRAKISRSGWISGPSRGPAWATRLLPDLPVHDPERCGIPPILSRYSLKSWAASAFSVHPNIAGVGALAMNRTPRGLFRFAGCWPILPIHYPIQDLDIVPVRSASPYRQSPRLGPVT